MHIYIYIYIYINIYINIYIYIYTHIYIYCIYTYTFIHIICLYIPNNELSFVIYMKLVQSMGSQRTRQFKLPPLYKEGIDFL